MSVLTDASRTRRRSSVDAKVRPRQIYRDHEEGKETTGGNRQRQWRRKWMRKLRRRWYTHKNKRLLAMCSAEAKADLRLVDGSTRGSVPRCGGWRKEEGRKKYSGEEERKGKR